VIEKINKKRQKRADDGEDDDREDDDREDDNEEADTF